MATGILTRSIPLRPTEGDIHKDYCVSRIDLATTTGVETIVTAFLQECGGSPLAVGGAIEVLQSSLPLGWSPDAVRTEVGIRDDYPFEDEVTALITRDREEFAEAARETKYRIAAIKDPQGTGSELRATFVPITYEEVVAFHQSLTEAAARSDMWTCELRTRWAKQLLATRTCRLPGSAVMHIVVITGDNQVVLCRRSPRVHYHPSHWSITLEEQINEMDCVAGSIDLFAAAKRGFREELGPDANVGDVRVWSVFLEFGILNLGFCSCIETPLCFDEIRYSWNAKARDKWEATDVVGEPFTPANVGRLFALNKYGAAPDEIGSFHPTSKYRLLSAAVRRFGWDAIVPSLI